MGLRCVNDYMRYCTHTDRLQEAQSSSPLYLPMREAEPCRLKPPACGYCETLSEQVAKLPPPPPKTRRQPYAN
jgi:hypothetical protein